MRIGYVRVSTAEQAENGLSLDAQEAKLREAGCERIYADRGVSGRQTSRPEFDRMIDALRRGDTVVIWKLDRLGRDAIHLQQTAVALKAQGVGLESVTESFLNSGAEGVSFMVGLFALLAQMESDKISERTKLGMAQAKANGAQIGGRAPVTADSPKVRTAAKLHAQGWNAAQIAQEAARLHGGKVASRQTVYRWLDLAGVR
ncbi:recombinase family protein [Kocuria rosea]|uniref:recombinase family protein n=1 Tax=Kocuria rosea TaxID=1275 RepID=UPI00232E083C|nr:recombinase family protein [Kocuria rosea]